MKPLLAVKLKRELLAVNAGLTVQLRNVDINGAKKGCSGFVTDSASGRIVYINTEPAYGPTRRAMFRVARHDRDYTGGMNHFAGYDELAAEVVKLLTSASFDRELPEASRETA